MTNTSTRNVQSLPNTSLQAIVDQFIQIKLNALNAKATYDGTEDSSGLPNYYAPVSADFTTWLINLQNYANTRLGKKIDFSSAKYQKRMDKGAFVVTNTNPLQVQYEGLEEYFFSNLIHIGRALGQSAVGADYWKPKD